MRLVALLVLAAACGDNVSASDFPAEQRDATCGFYVRCGAFATVSDCRLYYAQSEVDSPNLEAALDAGRIRYSGDAAERCIDTFKHLDCDINAQPANALAACDDVFTGTGEVGDGCAFNGECLSENCDIPLCTGTCCQGTCGPPRIYPGLDEPCTTVCAEGLFCALSQFCEAELGVGEPCGLSGVCAYPLYCNAQNVCAERPGHGEKCDGPCALVGDVCNYTFNCVSAAVGGDDCSTNFDCSPFYVCNTEVGECNLRDQTPRAPNGSLCNFGGDCQSGYCDGVCMDAPLCF